MLKKKILDRSVIVCENGMKPFRMFQEGSFRNLLQGEEKIINYFDIKYTGEEVNIILKCFFFQNKDFKILF